MGHTIDLLKRDEKMEKMFKELKTAKLSPRNRQTIGHLEQWLNTKGFLTIKQHDLLCNIYAGASCGKG